MQSINKSLVVRELSGKLIPGCFDRLAVCLDIVNSRCIFHISAFPFSTCLFELPWSIN